VVEPETIIRHTTKLAAVGLENILTFVPYYCWQIGAIFVLTQGGIGGIMFFLVDEVSLLLAGFRPSSATVGPRAAVVANCRRRRRRYRWELSSYRAIDEHSIWERGSTGVFFAMSGNVHLCGEVEVWFGRITNGADDTDGVVVVVYREVLLSHY
jgi:hypothetical protein